MDGSDELNGKADLKCCELVFVVLKAEAKKGLEYYDHTLIIGNLKQQTNCYEN